MVFGAIGGRDDPVMSYNFQISLVDSGSAVVVAGAVAALAQILEVPVGGFNECTGLEMSLDVEDYMEGGSNGTVLKFPSRVKWNSITLKKGMTLGTELWDWFYGFVEGRGKRKDGLIVLQNERHLPHTVWGFRRGLPVKYSGPALNAGQSNVSIESIDIAHDGLYQIGGVGSVTAAADCARIETVRSFPAARAAGACTAASRIGP